MEQKIKKIIEDSSKIVIVGHLGADPDSVSSILFTYQILKKNYTNTKIWPIIDGDVPENMKFLNGFQDIEYTSIEEAVKNHDPDLLIVLDTSEKRMISKTPEELVQLIGGVKTIVIDHHSSNKSSDLSDVFINNNASSTTEELYYVLVAKLGLKVYKNYYIEVGLGIIADTGRFTYPLANPKRTFDLFSKLIKEGFSVDAVLGKLQVYPITVYKILACYFKNTTIDSKYTYSFISEEDIASVGCNKNEFKIATRLFSNTYLKTTKHNWGFCLKPGEKSGLYNVSFRSQTGVVDCRILAGKFGGGGHEGAAGGELKAKSIMQAIEKVKDILNISYDEPIKTA